MVGCENCCRTSLVSRFAKTKRDISVSWSWPFVNVRTYTVLWCRHCYFGNDRARRGMHCDTSDD